MNVSRITLIAIAALLIGAEIVRPTTFTVKKIGRASLVAVAPDAPLDPEALADLPPIVTPAIGNVDAAFAIDGARIAPLRTSTVLGAGDAVLLVGWLGDPETRATGRTLIAIVDGTRRLDASAGYDRPRPDVSRALGRPELGDAGFDVRLRASALGPGTHTIRLAVVAHDGRGLFVFPTPVRVRVAGGA